ncbi:MAG: CoA-binding protein, partial [Rubrobacteraceae bacterium]|nr:CoA-binding protein [Rubrobacteraceae bacterium]
INPLLASPERLIALDARIVLHDPETKDEDLPRTAIRPYPKQYVSHEELRNGTPVTIRPIRPEDEPLMVRFHETLSEQSVYMRYFHMMNLTQRTAHEHTHLLYRLRPRDGAGRQIHRSRDRGT